ncbi:MAG: YceD family protein [Arhodomonas sp.]|nr:YceD family protein [Arhodomonas sp.]
MHEETLPSTIDLRRVGAAGLALSGELPLGTLKRLAAVLAGEAQAATAEITIARKGNDSVEVAGSVAATLPLTCQRCLEVAAVTVSGEFRITVVADEAAAEGLDEAFVAPQMQLALHELLEEELLLELPVVARHAENEPCVERSQHFGPPGEAVPERENPFAVLAELKGRDRGGNSDQD